MDQSMLRTCQTMARVQSIISSSDTLDVALRDGARTIADEMDAEAAVLWYAENDVLRPYFWMGPLDITSERRRIGEGVVGRVFESQKAVRLLGNTSERNEHIKLNLRDKVDRPFALHKPWGDQQRQHASYAFDMSLFLVETR